MNGLIEAYLGHYEKAIKSSYDTARAKNLLLKYDDFAKAYVMKIIQIDHPERRLEVYCMWHGFKGYAYYLYQIATDKIPEYSRCPRLTDSDHTATSS